MEEVRYVQVPDTAGGSGVGVATSSGGEGVTVEVTSNDNKSEVVMATEDRPTNHIAELQSGRDSRSPSKSRIAGSSKSPHKVVAMETGVSAVDTPAVEAAQVPAGGNLTTAVVAQGTDGTAGWCRVIYLSTVCLCPLSSI